MSTTIPTGQIPSTPVASTPVPAGPIAATPAPAPRRRSSGWVVATFGAAALALVGMIAAVFMAFATPATAGTSSSTGSQSSSHSAVVHGGGHHHHTVQPSAQIETWQKDLGQLNYYEGPINGFMTPQTVQAITYLQAAAHLPQTGTMDAPTQAAMQYMLVHGNNQMGS
jgi:hypothetical protein